jgi:serine/threonine protein kinase
MDDQTQVITSQIDKTGIIDVSSHQTSKTSGGFLSALDDSSLNIFRTKKTVEEEFKKTKIINYDKIEIDTISPENLPDINQRYFLLDNFQEGGQGTIMTAKDLILKRYVAVKSLKEELLHQKNVAGKFISEAEVTAQLDHPSIIPLYSLNSDKDSGLHLAMKLVNGMTMKEYIEETRLNYRHHGVESFDEKHSLSMRLEHFLKVCEAMTYAHSKNVLHRDLKPENVMIGEFGEVYVMDWGIACLYDPEKNMTIEPGREENEGKPGTVPGTPRYMPPEVIYGYSARPQSDIFALGLILFEICTLKTAISGKTVEEVIDKILRGNFEPLEHYFKEISIHKDLKAIIAKATHLQPEKRYVSVEELANDVRSFLRNDEVSARPDNIPRRICRLMYKHTQATISIVLFIILMFAGLSIFSLFQQNQAIAESKRRELTLTSLQNRIAKQAYYIDTHFMHMEDTLKYLGEKAVFLLENKIPSNGERIYSYTDLRELVTAPDDLDYSPLYKKNISLDYPVYKLAPGLPLRQALPEIESLINLRKDFLKILIGSQPNNQFDHTKLAEQKRIALETGYPLRWAYVGLSDGLYMSYPGKSEYPYEYDPRQRPWYKMALKKRGTNWGNPYIDIGGQGIVLPCAFALYDQYGRFYGVAGLDVTFDYIIKMMTREDKDDKSVICKYLLDEKGRIIIKSTQSNKYVSGELFNKSIDIPYFPDKEVRDKITKQHLLQIECDNNILISAAPIYSLGWYYVAKIDLNKLINSNNGESPSPQH